MFINTVCIRCGDDRWVDTRIQVYTLMCSKCEKIGIMAKEFIIDDNSSRSKIHNQHIDAEVQG